MLLNDSISGNSIQCSLLFLNIQILNIFFARFSAVFADELIIEGCSLKMLSL